MIAYHKNTLAFSGWRDSREFNSFELLPLKDQKKSSIFLREGLKKSQFFMDYLPKLWRKEWRIDMLFPVVLFSGKLYPLLRVDKLCMLRECIPYGGRD